MWRSSVRRLHFDFEGTFSLVKSLAVVVAPPELATFTGHRRRTRPPGLQTTSRPTSVVLLQVGTSLASKRDTDAANCPEWPEILEVQKTEGLSWSPGGLPSSPLPTSTLFGTAWLQNAFTLPAMDVHPCKTFRNSEGSALEFQLLTPQHLLQHEAKTRIIFWILPTVAKVAGN